MNQENGKGIIFGVLGILTLIIAIMGASLAYFTATAMDTDPEEIVVQAATVTIAFENGSTLEAKDLIPAKFNVVYSAYLRGVVTNEDDIAEDKQCIDDKGYKVCSVYRFSIGNEAGKNDSVIAGTITTTTDAATANDGKEFENLKYTLYEVELDEGDWNKVIDRTEINTCGSEKENDKFGNYDKCHITFSKSGSSTQVFNRQVDEFGKTSDGLESNEYKVGAKEKKYFELVIWLNEKADDVTTDDGNGKQDEEQGLYFSASINVSVSGASDKITGTSVSD